MEQRSCHKCMHLEEVSNTVIWILASNCREFYFLKMLAFCNCSLGRRTSTTTTANAWRDPSTQGTSVAPEHDQRNVGLEIAGPSSPACCDQPHDIADGLTASQSCAAIHSSPQHVFTAQTIHRLDEGIIKTLELLSSMSSWLKTRLIPEAGLFVHPCKVNHHSSFHGININTYSWEALKQHGLL